MRKEEGFYSDFSEEECLEIIEAGCGNLGLHWEVFRIDNPEVHGFAGRVGDIICRTPEYGCLYQNRQELLQQMVSLVYDRIARLN